MNDCVKLMHDFTDSVIKERKDQVKAEGLNNKNSAEDELLGKKKRLAFLDLLIDASDDGKALSNADIREEV